MALTPESIHSKIEKDLEEYDGVAISFELCGECWPNYQECFVHLMSRYLVTVAQEEGAPIFLIVHKRPNPEEPKELPTYTLPDGD